MQDIGKPFDHGLPPEVEADNDLEALRYAAELVGRALEKVGGTEKAMAHEVIYPLLDRAGRELLRLIQYMKAREEQA